jgi:hypothetical protein
MYLYIFMYIDIINGLAFVYDWYLTNGKPPSVLSMSLGGEHIYIYIDIYKYL